MGGKLSQAEFVRRAEERYPNEYTVLSQYTRGHELVAVRRNECGHEWKTDPWSLMQGNIKKCPICNNKWKRNTEDFKKEVFDRVGDEYSVVSEYIGTNKPILMRHNVCGNTFVRLPREFKKGVLCPTCRRPNYNEDTESFSKRLKEKWGGKYELVGKYVSARQKVGVKCLKCGAEFSCTPDNLMRGHGCPHCTISRGEDRIELWLKKHGIKYETQYTDKRCKNIRALRFDFAVFVGDNLQTLIEFDGAQHSRPTRFNNKMPNGECEENLLKCQENDRIKTEFCASNNIPLLRISYKQFDKIEKILDEKLLTAIPC